VFKGQEEIISQMLKEMHTKLFMPEDVIISIMDSSSHFYLLARGEANVEIVDENMNRRCARVLNVGDYFGEVGIIKG
jgi:CRP-like cAMP-binding protein